MNEDQKYVCPNCNGLIDYGTKFCPHCGTTLNFAQQDNGTANAAAASDDLLTEAEYRFSKAKLIHGLLSIIKFEGTKVKVTQKNKWLGLFGSSAGSAEFNIMDIESIYIKKSYDVKMCILFAMCFVVCLLVQEFLYLAATVMIGFSLRETALVIKYKGGYLKLVNDKGLFDYEKHDDPQLVLDYIKQYKPECVHVLMD